MPRTTTSLQILLVTCKSNMALLELLPFCLLTHPKDINVKQADEQFLGRHEHNGVPSCRAGSVQQSLHDIGISLDISGWSLKPYPLRMFLVSQDKQGKQAGCHKLSSSGPEEV